MIQRTISLIGGGIALTLLGGCLGTDNPDFNQQALDGIAFVNNLEDLPQTAASDMPTTGTAEYRGVASLTYDQPISNSNPGTDLYADMALTADFDTNDITGTISQFNSPNGNVSGTIDVTSGAIAQNFMQANANGTVVDEGQSIDLQMDLAGEFRDENGEAITGVITGSYTPEGEGTGDLYGVFGVDQN